MSSSATTRLSILAPVGQPSVKSAELTEETKGPSEANDESIMIRVQEGDSDALAMLFGRYARLVRVVSIRILRDEAEADDLVQELFLFVHRGPGYTTLEKHGEIMDCPGGTVRLHLFALGLFNAALFSATILPLSTRVYGL